MFEKSNNISHLAHLLNQKFLNKYLFEEKIIPTYMYEQANEALCKKIDELERHCYTCI